MNIYYSLITFLFYFNSVVTAADTNTWKSRSIYFVLTDRIARNSNDNGGGSCGNLQDYCGGTFKGLESKLDYIKGMGFDAIWITPVVTNSAGGYHGYWAKDLYGINSNYGTADDLKSLVNTSHSKGVFVMVDVVVNHMGFGAIEDNRPAPLNQQASYHAACAINYNDQNSVEQCRVADLPDVNTQKSEIRTLYQDWIRWLVKEYQFDGIRIDTVKHVEKDYFPGFASAAGVYSIGEVLSGDSAYLAGYSSVLPGLLNYAVYYPMNRFYQQQGSAQELVDMLNLVGSTFSDPTALGTFLDNHDNPRWLSQKNDISLFKNALAFVILSRGIPIVYYGTEQGFSGGADPSNREDLWRSSYNTQSNLYQTISRLLGARKAAGGLAGNDLVHLHIASNAYAWSRAGGNLIVLTTNSGSGSSGNYCFNSQKTNGKWTDTVGGGAYTSDGSGNLCITVANGEPVVLVAGSGNSGSTTTNSPGAASSAKPACPSTVAVTFNHKMITAFGESIKIAGSVDQLGNWDTSKATALSASQYTTQNPIWSIKLSLPAGKSVQYKFIRVSASGVVTWESDPNRSYSVPSCQASDTVSSSNP